MKLLIDINGQALLLPRSDEALSQGGLFASRNATKLNDNSVLEPNLGPWQWPSVPSIE